MSHLFLRPIENKSRTPTNVLENSVIKKDKTKTGTTTRSKQKFSSSEATAQDTVTTISTTNKGFSTKLVSLSILPLDLKQLFEEKNKTTSQIFDPQQHHQLAKSTAIIDRKRRRKRKNRRSCSSDIEKTEADDSKPMLRTDVEVFQGKIVFNLDGNAFIIATENSTQDLIVNATATTTTVPSFGTASEVGENITGTSETTAAATKSIKTSLNIASTSKEALSSRDGEQKAPPKSAGPLKTTASPRIHSFRIVSAQDATATVVATTAASIAKNSTVEQSQFETHVEYQQPQLELQLQQRRRRSNTNDIDNDNDSDSTNGNNIVKCSSKIQKPILMCFICKLSFGNTKSFRLHASSEHQLTLQSKEQQLLNREYSSVIIQPPNMDERPEISFLEPIDMLNVIKSDDLNTATDVEFNENTSQVVTHEFNTGDTSMTVRPAVKKLINEIAEDMTATTGANSSMLSTKASIPTSTSPPTSTTMSTDLTLSSVKSPKCSRSATATLPAVSQIASTFEPNGTIDCSNNSNFLRVNSLSECARQKPRYEATAFVNDSSVITATTVSNHPSGISKPNSIENQQQETIIITNRLKTATVETQETDDSKAKVATSSPSLPSSLTFLSPSSFPLSLLPKNESEDVSKTEVTVFGSSSDSTLKAKLTVCETPPTASATRNNRSSNTGNRNLLGDREDCYSSPLCTVTKMENIEMGSTTATSANVSDILHMNLHRDSPTVDDNKLDRSETQSRLSEDAVNFHQQQQQFAAMSSSTFASPSPSLISMTPTANNLSSLHASLVALNDGFPTTCDSTDPQKTGARIISDFLQQHLSLQHQQQYGALNGKCAEHSDYKDNDYKNCEIQQLKSSPHHNQGHQHTLTNTNTTPQRSPSRSSNSGTSTIMRSPANSTTSPNATIVNVSAAAVAAAASQQQNTVAAVAVAAAAAAAAVVSVASNNSSFTIGACSDHMNGRPLGVECTRCEMILNSTRLNTGVQMSTRNSCKTLKCPQCNWHYKYQETLEIHMREKHPDGESACGYCLSGQQHPRLARGESYSCGYKPYRCEICNYSTTTKGNLSIHMQSDKHLNNMQELNSSQSMLAAAVAAASSGKADITSKMMLSNNIAAVQQPQQQQTPQPPPQQTISQPQSQQPQSSHSGSSSILGSGGSSASGSGRTSVDATGNACVIFNKSKPSFRCDICNYETSVARNLRIHMTSEKHTHNMTALQNNIKHIQAYSIFQQHQQAVVAAAAQQQQQHQQQQQLTAATQAASQLPALGSGLASNFLPEIALADLAYNQALMIQLLQQNSAAISQQQQQQPHDSVPKLQLKASPRSSPHPMQVEQPLTFQQQQLQQLRQQLLQSYSPNSGSPTLLLSTETFGTSDVNLSSSVSGGCNVDETLEPPVRADPCPTNLYSCLVCDIFSSNSLDDLNQHLLVDRSRCNTMTTSSTNNSNTLSTINTDVMVILNNNYICRLCNYKTNLKANFQLHSKTDKHLQKLNYINHIREGGPHNEYKLKYIQLAANTVQLKCNCCDFYTNSIQKLSLHTQHMRHETMRMIFQHLLHIMQQNNLQHIQMQQHSKSNPHESTAEIGDSSTEPHGGNIDQDSKSDDTPISAIATKDMPKFAEKVISCQLCNYSTCTLLNMIQHVKSLRHMQVEQFVSLQRRSEQLDPPSLDDVFKVVEQPILQSLPPSAHTSQDDNSKLENIRSVSVPGYFSVPTTRLTNEDNGYNISVIDHNSFSPSSNSSIASGNTSVRSKGYQRVSTPNFQSSIGDRDGLTTNLGSAINTTGIPSVVFKCNNCDFFAQSKTEMELHLGAVHPQTEPDYISIPTNSVAMQAFQAAVAAATAAAACAVTATHSGSSKSNFENDAIDDDCPTSIKRERLFLPEDEEFENGADMSSTLDLQNASTISPWITTTINTNEFSPSINESRSGSNNVISRELEEKLQQHQSVLKSIKIVLNDIDDSSQVDQSSTNYANVQCPLCTGTFDRKQTLESHLMNVHSVNRDGLARLLQLVDTSVWKHFHTESASADAAKTVRPATETNTIKDINNAGSTELNLSTMAVSSDASINLNTSNPTGYVQSLEAVNSSELSCEQCCTHFKHEQQLLQHVQKFQHFVVLPNGDHRCLAASHPSRPCHATFPSQTALIAHYKNVHISLIISERHVYKYRCKHCSLAFKTQEKLSTHLLYHTMRDATKCTLCQRNFRSTQALQKHMDQIHSKSNQHVSSSPTLLSCSSRGSPTFRTTNSQLTEAVLDNAPKTNDGDACQSPPISPHSKEQMDSKNLNETSQVSSSPLTAHILQDQQQHVAAFTAALLNQSSQQQHCSSDELAVVTQAHLIQHLQTKPSGSLLTQKYIQQQQQKLQNIQHLQQLPQLPGASTGLPLNPVEMLNLMQFHRIMSMNFMNLAPPLIFGVGANASASNNTELVTSPHTPKIAHNCGAHTLLSGSDLTIPGTPVPVGSTADIIGTLPKQQQSQQQQSVATSISQMASNQKRARTRITDEQLKILRAHFDINNSPSEESIMEMSQKANLPMKVVKHWFRNTLFKERQRNKDSPYNFNNPPSTTLNLEEYERTGQAKVTPLNEELNLASFNLTKQQEQQQHKISETKGQDTENESYAATIPSTCGDSPISIDMKNEPINERVEDHCTTDAPHSQQQQQQQQHKDSNDKHLLSPASALLLHQRQQRISAVAAVDPQQQQVIEMQDHTMIGTAVASMLQQQHVQSQSNQGTQQHINLYSYETKSESGSSDILSRPQSPNTSSIVSTHFASINELLNQQLDNLPLSQNLTSINVATIHGNNMGPPKNFQTSKSFEKNSPSSQFDTNSNSSNASSTSSGKRANRTRFTDYQIKVLQEFFENNSYPKDSDLEYLSKLLLLSPRVIVVWFQNARQKQRKIYENQPNNSLYETEEKKHNINYACKKCNLAFQRYYELIRHQKNHCFKEENNKKSAKAQIAAAQIAQNLSSEDSNSSIDINSGNAVAQLHHQQHGSAVTTSHNLTNSATDSSISPCATSTGLNVLHNTSPQHLFGKSSMSITDFSPSTTPTPPQSQRERNDSTELSPQGQAHKSKFECEKCKIHFGFYEHFREHQLLHLMNPGLFTSQLSSMPDTYGTFGSILQSLQQVAAANATHQQQQQQLLQQQGQPSAKKRKCSETSSITDDMSSIGGTGDIDTNPISLPFSTPRKYDFLYQYFMQNESSKELKQQFQSQQQQAHEPELEMEFLANFYHQCELRKRSNYDFLYQYYQKNERKQQMGAMQSISGAFESENKPHIDFLLQYYQLNESKKFFQLDASNPRINDHTSASHSLTAQYQHINNLSSNSRETNTSKGGFVMLDSNLTKNSLEVLSSNIGLSDGEDNNDDNDRNSNGMEADDAHSCATDHNDDNNRKIESNLSYKKRKSTKNTIKGRRGSFHEATSTMEISGGINPEANLLSQQQVKFTCMDEDHKRKDVSKDSGKFGKNQKSNHTKRKASSLATQSTAPLTKKATTTLSAISNVETYIHNLKDFLDANTIETPTQTTQHNSDNLVQTDTDGSSGATAMDKMLFSETPSSSPNSNNNSSVVGPPSAKPGAGIAEKQQSKRLRTTILPEQLNFLYECYQNESNPSRKMLEEIAKKVNLKKRVVQ